MVVFLVAAAYRWWRLRQIEVYTEIAQFNAVYEGLEHTAEGAVNTEADGTPSDDDELLRDDLRA